MITHILLFSFHNQGGAFFWVASADVNGAWSDLAHPEVTQTAGCSASGTTGPTKSPSNSPSSKPTPQPTVSYHFGDINCGIYVHICLTLHLKSFTTHFRPHNPHLHHPHHRP